MTFVTRDIILLRGIDITTWHWHCHVSQQELDMWQQKNFAKKIKKTKEWHV